MNSAQRAVLILMVLGSVAVYSGCAYTTNRLNDLTDICQAKIMFGEGVDLSARALWVGLGLGYSDSVSIGFGQRGYGVWKSERTDVQMFLPYMNREEAETDSGTVDALSGNIEKYGVGDRGLVASWPPAGQDIEYHRFTDPETYESYLRLGVTAQLILGADLELRPVEMIDFLLGFFTIDFRGDDNAE